MATQSGRYYRVERRYSAFHSLNKECKRQYHGQSHRIAEFPPKRIRNTSAKVLESRRTGLEHYIQSLVRLSPTPPQLIAFLELPPRYVTFSLKKKQLWVAIHLSFLPASLEVGESCHGAVIGFKRDPALGVCDNLSRQPRDMITQGGITCLKYYQPGSHLQQHLQPSTRAFSSTTAAPTLCKNPCIAQLLKPQFH